MILDRYRVTSSSRCAADSSDYGRRNESQDPGRIAMKRGYSRPIRRERRTDSDVCVHTFVVAGQISHRARDRHRGGFLRARPRPREKLTGAIVLPSGRKAAFSRKSPFRLYARTRVFFFTLFVRRARGHFFNCHAHRSRELKTSIPAPLARANYRTVI